jgi:hypothetical protein
VTRGGAETTRAHRPRVVGPMPLWGRGPRSRTWRFVESKSRGSARSSDGPIGSLPECVFNALASTIPPARESCPPAGELRAVVPRGGVEPPCANARHILSVVCLPFHHLGMFFCRAVVRASSPRLVSRGLQAACGSHPRPHRQRPRLPRRARAFTPRSRARASLQERRSSSDRGRRKRDMVAGETGRAGRP